jgi:hypothetical protein
MPDVDAAWNADVELRQHAAQLAEAWAFVTARADGDEGRRDELLRQLFRMARERTN